MTIKELEQRVVKAQYNCDLYDNERPFVEQLLAARLALEEAKKLVLSEK